VTFVVLPDNLLLRVQHRKPGFRYPEPFRVTVAKSTVWPLAVEGDCYLPHFPGVPRPARRERAGLASPVNAPLLCATKSVQGEADIARYCITKALGKFDSMLVEFDWPVCPLKPGDSHFRAVASGNATDVMVSPNPSSRDSVRSTDSVDSNN